MGDTGFSYAWVTASIPAGALLMLAKPRILVQGVALPTTRPR